MFLQASVILLTGGVSAPGGCLLLEGAWSRGVPGLGGCLVPGGACLVPGGAPGPGGAW